MNSFRFLAPALLLFSLSLFAAPPSQLVLEGRVADSTQAVIPAARVELYSSDGKLVASTQSSGDGSFRLTGLNPGSYELRVAYLGFQSQRQHITIADGTSLNADVTMKSATVNHTVNVTAEAVYLEPNARSATRMDIPLRDVPQSVGVVNSELIRAQAVTSLQDAVRNVAGVNVHLGEGRRDQVLIRGFSAVNDEFIDGVRDDSPYYRDLSNVERIEVVKGPASVLYGRGSSGGIVNRITKSPLPTGSLGEFAIMFGSYGTKRLTADYDHSINERLMFRATAAYEDSGTFRHGFALERYAASPSLLWKPSAYTDVVFQSDNLFDSRVPDRGVPSLNGVPANVSLGNNYGYPSDDYIKNNIHGQTLRVEHRHKEWTARNTFRHTIYGTRFSTTQPTGTKLTSGVVYVSREQYNSASDQENYFNQTEASRSGKFLGLSHTILIGAEYGHQTRDTTRFNGTAALVTLMDPLLTRPTYGTAPTSDNNFTGTVAALYAQNLVDFGHGWKAMLGGRFDYYKQSLDDHLLANIDLHRTDRQFSPRAGIVYQPASWASVYGNFSRSFQPSGEGLSLAVNTAELKPEITSNYEVGSKFEFLGGRLGSTVSLFRLDRDNVKTTDPANTSKLLPVGLQRTNGFEVSFSGRPLPRVEIFGGFAWLDAKTVRSTSLSSGVALQGKRAALVPENSFNLWSTYSFSSGFGLGGGVICNTQRYAEANNLVALPSYTRVDATVFYRKSRYDVALNLRNVGNVRYYESAHTNYQIMPGAPINGVITTRVHW